MGKAPEGGFNSPDHDRGIGEGFLNPVRVDDNGAVGAKPGFASGGVCVFRPRLQTGGQVADHGVRVSCAYGKKEPGLSQLFEILG